jgi:2-polyprenyl-6-hydroxyphenyl methylase/3-demethylubiquinone-9 3-methyltransferase
MPAEINNKIYDELAGTWWDENEFLYLLKMMVNPWRVPYFKRALLRHFSDDLRQVRLLDIGAGGGVLAEEFAALGCRVTGIDISPQSIAAAQAHAARNGLSIDYGSGQCKPAMRTTAFRQSPAVMCWKHIRDWKQVIAEAGRVLLPGGLFLLRYDQPHLKSRVTFIYGLQELPYGTHACGYTSGDVY